jgi:nitrogen fixation/metabolism regulation signal transduction histidine kinase
MFLALFVAVCGFTSLWVTPIIEMILNSHFHIIIQVALGIAIFCIGVVSALFIIILGTVIGKKIAGVIKKQKQGGDK